MATTLRRRALLTLRRRVGATPGLLQLARPCVRAYRRLRTVSPTPAQQKTRDYDDMTVEAARRSLTGTGVCIDIGANRGDLLRQFIAVSPTSRFVAIEPIPALAKGLRRQWPAVVVHQVALSDATGTATLRYLPDRPTVSSLHVRADLEAGQRVVDLQVEVETLDTLAGPGRVEFVKIDVEGAELQVLRGSRGTLQRDRPVIVIESGGDSNLRAVEQCLAELDYRMWSMRGWLSGEPAVEDCASMLQLHADGEYQFIAAPSEPTTS